LKILHDVVVGGVLKKLLTEGKQVYGYVTNEFMKDLGTFDRYETVKKMIESFDQTFPKSLEDG